MLPAAAFLILRIQHKCHLNYIKKGLKYINDNLVNTLKSDDRKDK